MKKPELVFNIVSVPVDALMLVAAGIFSFYSRLRFEELVGPVIYNLQLPEFLGVLTFVIPIMLLIFGSLGLYNLKGTRKFSQEFWRVVLGVSLGLFLVIILFFFNRELFPSRFIVLATWVLSIILVVFGRLILKNIQKVLFKRGLGLHRLVIINGNNQESKIIESVYKNKSLGYRLVAELPYDNNTMSELEKLYAENRFDEIMQTNASLSDTANFKIVEFVRKHGLQFSFVPNLFEVQRNVVEVSTVKGIPIISLKNTPLDGWGKVVKRIFDIIVSTICIVITSPLFILIAIGIKLDSRGPVIYSAQRGSRNKAFWFYKFRSMHAHLSVGEGYGGEEAEKLWLEMRQNNARGGSDGAVSKFKDDPRVTRFGKFLRKTKLDELPQFVNVLKGDISMVGPRPHVLPELENYKHIYPRVLSIKPGIFGLSQLAIISRPLLPFEEEMRLNMFYIENWSLWLDIKVLANSFWMLFFAKKPKEDF